MRDSSRTWPTLCALALLLPGCAAGGLSRSTAHLDVAECVDLAALKAHAPITRARNMSELAALEKAGYHPEWLLDPFYPEDLEEAQHRVDYWYQTECPQARHG